MVIDRSHVPHFLSFYTFKHLTLMPFRIFLLRFSLLLVSGLFWVACGTENPSHKEDEHEPSGGGEHPQGDHPRGDGPTPDAVELSARQLEAVEVRWGALPRHNLKQRIKTNGEVAVPPNNRADISPFIGGNMAEIRVIPGDSVLKGQMIARMEHPAYIQLQEEFLDLRSQMDFLRAEFQRQQRLYQDQVNAAREYQQARADYRAGQARLASLGARMGQLGLDTSVIARDGIQPDIPIRAPFDGSVTAVNINRGAYAAPGQVMFSVLDQHHIHLELQVYQQDIHRVRRGQEVLFRPDAQRDRLLRGKVITVGRSYNKKPRAVRVHARPLEGLDRLLPGMYVEGFILTGDAQEGVEPLLPEDALVQSDGKTYAFYTRPKADQMAGGGRRFYRVAVQRHERVMDQVPVKMEKALPQDAQVVLKGAYYLISEMEDLGGGHAH